MMDFPEVLELLRSYALILVPGHILSLYDWGLTFCLKFAPGITTVQ